MNQKQLQLVMTKAIELDNVLNGMKPAMMHEVFRLALADRSDEELVAIIKAAKDRYEGITARDILDKLPSVEVNVTTKGAKRKR